MSHAFGDEYRYCAHCGLRFIPDTRNAFTLPYCRDECVTEAFKEAKLEVESLVSAELDCEVEDLDSEHIEGENYLEESKWVVWVLNADQGGGWNVSLPSRRVEFESCIKGIKEVAN